MRLAVVAQRYGEAINGGAELHARYIAEHLARHAEVEVLTTCALNYVTWKNELPAGVEQVNGLTTRRFKVSHQRNPLEFGRWSRRVFEQPHSLAHELAWLSAEGPASPSLVRHIASQRDAYDYFIFFSYRYYHAYHGARQVPDKAVLVPTAERDPAIGLKIFGPLLAGVRAVMYNSPEERAMIQAVAGNEQTPSVVVGIGSEVPANTQPGRFRQKYSVTGPFIVYVGRIDENKGCKELFEFFQAYLHTPGGHLSLILIGNSILEIPDHPRIRHLGFVDDRDKFDAMAAAELLIMPSYFESLSMVALEAWALGRPVVANAHCDVLKGQSIRSNAGLYYETAREFVEALRALEQNRWLSVALGRNGRTFFRENYDWSIIERKYLDMLARLSEEPAGAGMAPLPGWLARHQRNCPPAAQVLAATPHGASTRDLPVGPADTTAPAGGSAPEYAVPIFRSGPASKPPRRRHDRRGGPPRHRRSAP